MPTLIDGYNLLNATGVEGIGSGTELHRARQGLLNYLANAMSESEAAHTTIVFDAQGAPPGLPNRETYRGITALYSQGYAEADDLLEELIASDHSPRKLTVVSSDHRIHRAARRRKAMPIDSDIWMSQLAQRSGKPDARSAIAKPIPQPEQTDSWLAEFADVDVQAIQQELRAEDKTPVMEDKPVVDKTPRKPKPPLKEGVNAAELEKYASIFPDDFGSEFNEKEVENPFDEWNPFPPGYGEDITEEDV